MAEDEEVSVKRRRCEAQWKANIRKKCRAEGKEYTSRKGVVVEARKTGNTCRCSRKCLEHLSFGVKRLLLNNFNKLGEQKSQDAFLMHGIQSKNVQRRRSRKATENPIVRKASYNYTVTIGNVSKVVCRTAYASVFGVGEKRIRRISSAITDGTVPIDQRGQHNNRPFAKSEELKMKIRAHIEKFPYQLSHYGRNRTKRRYLASTLSVLKMYVLFLEEHYPEIHNNVKNGDKPETIKAEVSYCYYLKIFRDHFNYGFGRPRTDVCSKCEESKVKICSEKNAAARQHLQVELRLHKTRAAVFYTKLKEADEKAQEEDTEALCWDFQQNIPYPQLAVSDMFFLRQLWLYNFCVYSYKNHKGVMYSWPESEGNRGVNEVLSCLNAYIEKYVPNTVRKLLLFCDGCRGQNHNTYVINYLFSLVHSGRFESIELRMPVRAHSFLPCDRLFSVIERLKRKIEKVQSYVEWQDIISKRFTVERMSHQSFFYYKSHYATIFKKSFQQNKNKYHVTKYKVFVFSTHHKYEVLVSEQMSGFGTTAFKLLKPNARVVTVATQRLYEGQLQIKQKKLTNVLSVCGYLDNDQKPYYLNLRPIGAEADINSDESDYE